MTQRQIRQYYRQMLFGNRNLLARSIDFVALRLLLFFGFLIWFTLQTSNTTLGIVLAAVGTGMVSVALALYKSIRLDRFIVEKRTELKYHYLFEQMVLMPKGRFYALLRELARSMGYETQLEMEQGLLCENGQTPCFLFALQNHPENPVSAQQVLDCYRTAKQLELNECILVSTAPLHKDARSFLLSIQDLSFDVWNRQRLLALARRQNLLPDDEAVEAALLQAMERKRLDLKKLKRQAFQTTRIRAYVGCGLILFFATIITGQHLYYPIMGSLCFFMAFVSYFTGTRSSKEPDGKAHSGT